ncbi:MAG: DUF1501 domain-containing protein [Candidatus Binatia bacterium]|nr:DUF1501 domain-containing protein [Candidatus Binatia bacterium]
MDISRRRLLQGGALTGATLAIPGPLQRALFSPNEARAAGPTNPIIVVVQLEGGLDTLNTVVPVNDQPGFPQRTEYDAARSSIALTPAELAATTIGTDPVKGNTLALHPSLSHLKSLFDSGKLAVIQGVSYANQSLSHFRSEDIWFSGESVLPFADGWFGRYLDSYYTSSDLVTVDVDTTLSKMFVCPLGCNVLAVKKLSQFVLPDDNEYPDAVAKKTALEAMYAVEADPGETSGLQNTVGVSGEVLIGKIDEYAAIDTGWGSNLDGVSGSIADRLTEVSSIIRHDAVSGTPVGANYFHVRQGGYDTHTNQGSTSGRLASLFDQLSPALGAFYQDLQDINVEAGSNISDDVLVVTFSEFGRRIAENGGGGTDHGSAGAVFALGDCVNGGIYGEMPDIGAPDSKGNLVHHTDFRQVYASIIDNWLQSPNAHVPLLPGAPYTTIPFI